MVATGRLSEAEARPDAFLPGLASSLNNLSNHLSDLGRREDESESLAYFWVRFDGDPTPFETGQYMTIGVVGVILFAVIWWALGARTAGGSRSWVCGRCSWIASSGVRTCAPELVPKASSPL